MNLQLSLKKKWFEMTKSGEKTEDYREMTSYWFRRLFNADFEDGHELNSFIDAINYPNENAESLNKWFKFEEIKPKKFTITTITMGYPKSTNSKRILKLEHKGIEIREGNPDWGAEPGKIYFVIKHGTQINKL